MPPTYRGAGTQPAAGWRPPASSRRGPGCCPEMRLGRGGRPRPLWRGPPRTSAGPGPRWTGGPRRATESTPLLGEETVSGRPETADPASSGMEGPSAPGTPSPRSPLSRLPQRPRLLPTSLLDCQAPRPTFQLGQHLQLGRELAVEIVLHAAQLLLVVLHAVREPGLRLRTSRSEPPAPPPPPRTTRPERAGRRQSAAGVPGGARHWSAERRRGCARGGRGEFLLRSPRSPRSLYGEARHWPAQPPFRGGGGPGAGRGRGCARSGAGRKRC